MSLINQFVLCSNFIYITPFTIRSIGFLIPLKLESAQSHLTNYAFGLTFIAPVNNRLLFTWWLFCSYGTSSKTNGNYLQNKPKTKPSGQVWYILHYTFSVVPTSTCTKGRVVKTYYTNSSKSDMIEINSQMACLLMQWNI